MVLDHDDRLAGVDQPVQQPEQWLEVGQVQPGGQLVEDIDAAFFTHVRGELEPLPLATRQRGERLAEPQVAEPHVGHPLQDRVRGRRMRLGFENVRRPGAEKYNRVFDRQADYLGDVEPAEPLLQHRRLEPPALALLADRRDAGHHREVRVNHAGAVAGWTGALGVGAEQRGLHAVGFRERVADRIEQAGVGCRVAPPRATDGSGQIDTTSSWPLTEP